MRLLHVSGYCLLREPMAHAAIEAARLARRVTVDLASAHDIEILGARRFVARLKALAPDLAFATEAERAAVPGFDAAWVIKLGRRGAGFPEGLYPAPPVVALDTTGAGRRPGGRLPGGRAGTPRSRPRRDAWAWLARCPQTRRSVATPTSDHPDIRIAIALGPRAEPA